MKYCDILMSAEYDVKTIKLADRNKQYAVHFQCPSHSKVEKIFREKLRIFI